VLGSQPSIDRYAFGSSSGGDVVIDIVVHFEYWQWDYQSLSALKIGLEYLAIIYLILRRSAG
jgi:hypothetical protein